MMPRTTGPRPNIAYILVSMQYCKREPANMTIIPDFEISHSIRSAGLNNRPSMNNGPFHVMSEGAALVATTLVISTERTVF